MCVCVSRSTKINHQGKGGWDRLQEHERCWVLAPMMQERRRHDPQGMGIGSERSRGGRLTRPDLKAARSDSLLAWRCTLQLAHPLQLRIDY